ncbi:MAG: 50S ribosomal protein L25 [bacterium]|nr:50S ribosomal protein L25 [bacterium]
MALIDMTVYPRTTSGKNANRRTRAAGRTPAVVYGNNRDQASSLEFDTVQLERILDTHGGQNLMFSLKVEGTGESFVAVMRDLQQHPVSDMVYHCDLLEIPLDVPLTLEVGLNIHGEANKLVRTGDAIVDVVRRTVEIECLPRDVPESLDVDYTELKIGDKLTVRNLSFEKGRIMTDLDDIILKLNTHTFIEAAAAAPEGEAAAPEKKEETK